MESQHSRFFKHGIVVLAADPRIRFPLFRSDEVLCATGEVVEGNEWWCVDEPEGPDVEPLNSDCTMFKTSAGDLLVLEPTSPRVRITHALVRFKAAPAPHVSRIRNTSRSRVGRG